MQTCNQAANQNTISQRQQLLCVHRRHRQTSHMTKTKTGIFVFRALMWRGGVRCMTSRSPCALVGHGRCAADARSSLALFRYYPTGKTLLLLCDLLLLGSCYWFPVPLFFCHVYLVADIIWVCTWSSVYFFYVYDLERIQRTASMAQPCLLATCEDIR